MSEERQKTKEEIAAFLERSKAMTAKLLAEARKAEAEAMKAEQEVIEAECDATSALIVKRKTLEEEQRRLCDDMYHHRYVFNGQVTGSSVEKCIKELTIWHRVDPKCEMTIILNSPGGEVIAGMNLFDFIRYLSSEGHKITTVAMGYAASMAGILLQAGDHRIIGREAYLLIHEVSFSAAGSMGDVEDTVEWVKKVQDRVLDIFTARSAGKMKREEIEAKWKRKDWWLSSEEAMNAGFVDEVGP